MSALGVPPRKASGSGFPLQVLVRITALRAFRSNPSRGSVSNRDLVTKPMLLHCPTSTVRIFVNTSDQR